MADRILKRPMFRRGGSTNEGIMSGLVDRRGYAEGDKVGNQQDWRWLDESGLGKTLKFGGNLLLDTTSSIIDPFNVAINKGSEFFTGYNPGLSANRNVEEMKKSIFGDKAEIYDPNDPDRDEDANPNVAEFFGINTDATPTYPGQVAKEEVTDTVQTDTETENGNNIIDTTKEITIGDNTRESDVKAIYEDILPLLQSTMGVDDSELNRQKYLELAKFGANLMAQPGGSLTRAIGKAAEQPLEGLTRIAETKRKGKRAPAEIAMKIALAETESGPVGKQIRDLKKVYPQRKGETANEWNKRIGDKVLERGTATREATSEGRVKMNTDILIESDIFKTEADAAKVARAIDNTGLDITYFDEWPKDKADAVEGQHYYTKDGKLKLVKDKKVLTWDPKSKKFK